MSRQPVLFVSHGAPDVLLNPGATVHMWERRRAAPPEGDPRDLRPLGRREPTVSTAATPETIHDFGGFPPALYA
jgi:4,5-DOPA dioxygenase extradiol